MPLGATAQETGFEPDYALLFEIHADAILQATPGTRRLELPGPMVVEEITRGGVTRYRATDQSGHGAVLCQLDALLWAEFMAHSCPGLFQPAEAERLTGMTFQAAVFAGANTVPPLAPNAAIERLQASARGLASRARPACPDPDTPQAARLVAITGAGAQQRLAASLSLPRLPVSDPCE
nr:hypothetical protein [Mesobacterium pallidum]